MMELACIGLNHQTAPVELREKAAVPRTKLGDKSRELLEINGVKESLVLSTCNRTEYYIVADKAQDAVARISDSFYEMSSGLLVPDQHLYDKVKIDTARHLCRVCAGLDSMVLGETEIFGQVKDAYRQALDLGVTSKGINKLFQKAFSVGKKVRTKTSIQHGNISTGSVAVDLAQTIFGDLKKSHVLIIGAGEISRVTAQSLKSRGADMIHVANRSFDKAVEMANEFGGRAYRLDDWEKIIKDVDIVISSTGAPHFVVKPEHILSVRKARKYRPLFFIDLAVPRDIDPLVGEIEEAYLFDIDSLEKQAEDNRHNRQKEILLCESIIEEELEKSILPGI